MAKFATWSLHVSADGDPGQSATNGPRGESASRGLAGATVIDVDATAGQIFISFTHIDNAKLSDEAHGWIDRFHEALQLRIDQLWGTKMPIWRDPKIDGNDQLSETIEDAIRRSAVLVTVLSPGYVHSTWCRDEVRMFFEAASRSGGMLIGNKSRIFKAIKTPIGAMLERPLADLNDTRGYPFFRPSTNGAPCEFDPALGPQARQDFLSEVNELAYDLYKTLGDYLKKEDLRQPVATPTGQVVYLAETSYDLIADADQLRRQLEQFGHTVLPNVPVAHGPGYAAQVRELLERATLAINQVGAGYGTVPEGSERSVTALAYELACEESRRRVDFKRIAWMRPGTKPTDARQLAFVRALQDDPELLVSSLESLKTTAQETLHVEARPAAPQAPSVADSGVRSVYLICDPIDNASVQMLDDWLFARGIDVTRPLTSGTERELREDHIENLKTCDAVLLYHGRTTEFWRRTKLLDLQKVFGLGRARPFVACGVFNADPATPEKLQFRSNDMLVIEGFGATPAAVAELMEPYLKQIASGVHAP